MQQMCRGDDFRPVIIEVFDWNRTQRDQLIGTASTCLADLKRAAADDKPVVLALYDHDVGEMKPGGRGALRDCRKNCKTAYKDLAFQDLEHT